MPALHHQQLEQVELGLGELERSAAALGRAAERVEGEVGDPQQLLGSRHAGAAEQRAQPREQLVERERLDEVVVGAGVEPGHAVGDLVARGEHEDRGARLAARRSRRHAVSPSTVGIIMSRTTTSGSRRRDRLERLLAVGDRLDLVALEPRARTSDPARCGRPRRAGPGTPGRWLPWPGTVGAARERDVRPCRTFLPDVRVRSHRSLTSVPDDGPDRCIEPKEREMPDPTPRGSGRTRPARARKVAAGARASRDLRRPRRRDGGRSPPTPRCRTATTTRRHAAPARSTTRQLDAGSTVDDQVRRLDVERLDRDARRPARRPRTPRPQPPRPADTSSHAS